MSKPEILRKLIVGKVNMALYREHTGGSWFRLSYNGTRLHIRDYGWDQQATALSQWSLAESVVKDLVACFEQEDRNRAANSNEPKILFGNVTEDDQA